MQRQLYSQNLKKQLNKLMCSWDNTIPIYLEEGARDSLKLIHFDQESVQHRNPLKWMPTRKTSCHLVERYQHFREARCLFYPEDGDTKFHPNVGADLPDCMAAHPIIFTVTAVRTSNVTLMTFLVWRNISWPAKRLSDSQEKLRLAELVLLVVGDIFIFLYIRSGWSQLSP
jgi:hypothetical protein